MEAKARAGSPSPSLYSVWLCRSAWASRVPGNSRLARDVENSRVGPSEVASAGEASSRAPEAAPDFSRVRRDSVMPSLFAAATGVPPDAWVNSRCSGPRLRSTSRVHPVVVTTFRVDP